MSTSGGGTINALGYLLALVASLVAARAVLGDLEAWLRRPRAAAIAIWAAVAVPSLVELADHGLYDALSRQPGRIRDGQVWRLVTGTVVQDGGLVGTILNLVMLAVVATLAVHVWGPGRSVALFAVGALGFSLSATFASPAPGGGNSGATFFLATSITGLLLLGHPGPLTRVAAVLTALDGVVLLCLLDAHGEAIVGGLVVGAAVAALRPPARIPARAAG